MIRRTLLVAATLALSSAFCSLGLAGCKSSTTEGPPSLGGGPTGGTVIAPAAATAKAPESYKARFSTSKGDFVIEVTRAWAPLGADRFYNLVKGGFYDNTRFFRIVSGFMAQFGIHGDPSVSAQWKEANIKDDARTQSNKRGYVTFATSGPDSRTTQVFLNLVDNDRLDGMGFSPFGKIIEGQDVVDKLFSGYGEGAPRGQGPAQGRIQAEGNVYLEKDFPNLDFVKKATIQLGPAGATP